MTTELTETDRIILEQDMIAAITAYFAAEDPHGTTTRLKGVQVRAVTDNGDTPSGERLVYSNGESCAAMLILEAPIHGSIGAAEPPMLMARGTIPFTG